MLVDTILKTYEMYIGSWLFWVVMLGSFVLIMIIHLVEFAGKQKTMNGFIYAMLEYNEPKTIANLIRATTVEIGVFCLAFLIFSLGLGFIHFYPKAKEELAWKSAIASSEDVQGYQEYLSKYPDGVYSTPALSKLLKNRFASEYEINETFQNVPEFSLLIDNKIVRLMLSEKVCNTRLTVDVFGTALSANYGDSGGSWSGGRGRLFTGAKLEGKLKLVNITDGGILVDHPFLFEIEPQTSITLRESDSGPYKPKHAPFAQVSDDLINFVKWKLQEINSIRDCQNDD